MTAPGEAFDDEAWVLEGEYCWTLEGTFAIGTGKVVCVDRECAVLFRMGKPSGRIAGAALQRLRHAIALSKLPQIDPLTRLLFDDQCRAELRKVVQPVVDSANEARREQERRNTMAAELLQSIAELPTGATTNRRLISDLVGAWTKQNKMGRARSVNRTRAHGAGQGKDLKILSSVDSFRAEALKAAGSRRFGK